MPEAIRSGARSPTIAALILGAVIDYFRRIQLVPMIAAWTFLLVWRRSTGRRGQYRLARPGRNLSHTQKSRPNTCHMVLKH